MNSEKKNLTFEKALEKLETTVEALESEETSLEKSMKLFQEGKKLSNFCLKKLNEYEKQIKILIEKDNSDYKLDDFGDLSEDMEADESGDDESEHNN